jgi:hypothetical protein
MVFVIGTKQQNLQILDDTLQVKKDVIRALSFLIGMVFGVLVAITNSDWDLVVQNTKKNS